MKDKWIDLVAGISPEIFSAMASFILPGVATLLREFFPCLMHFDWNSEGWFMGVFAIMAYGLGKLAHMSARPESNDDFKKGTQKRPDIHIHLIAGITGLTVGLVPTLLFSNSCF